MLSDEATKTLRVLHILSHPIRFAIVDLICTKELKVGQIAEQANLPQAMTSQQLKILRDSDIVGSRRDGNRVYNKVTNTHAVKMVRFLRQFSKLGK
jgi:ArsR family transcriptional regulator